MGKSTRSGQRHAPALFAALAVFALGAAGCSPPGFKSKKAQATFQCEQQGGLWNDESGCFIDSVAPVVTGLSDSLTPVPSKSWTWACSDAGSSNVCSYRFEVDQDPSTVPSGEWGSETTASLATGNGVYYLHVVARDSFGNTSDVVHVSAVLDPMVPEAPTALSLVSPASSPGTLDPPVVRVSGVSMGDTVTLYGDSGCTVARGSAASSGSTVDITASVIGSDGQLVYYANRSVAGTSSACSTASLAYRLDTTAPVVTGLSNDPVVATSKSWVWGCTDAGSSDTCTYSVLVDQNVSATPTAAFSSNATQTLSAVTGRYYLHVIARDTAGNLSAPVHVYVDLDATAPAAPSGLALVSPATSPASDSTPEIEVSGVVAGDTVRLYTTSNCSSTAVATGTVAASQTSISLTASAIVADGSVSYYARATDPLGNASSCSSASVAYTLDTQGPVVTGLADDIQASPPNSKTWSWNCTDGGVAATCSYVYLVDLLATTEPTGIYSTTTMATQVIQGSGSGIFYIHVRAMDAAGNLSSTVHVKANLFNSVPGAPPMLTLKDPATTPGMDTTPEIRVGGIAPGEKVTLYSNASCTTPASAEVTAVATVVDITVSPPLSGDGARTFYAKSVDADGDPSPCSSASVSYTLDLQAPAVTGLADSNTPERTKTFTWGCSEAGCTYSYVVDESATTIPSGAFSATATTTISTGSGVYHLHVIAKDTAGNLSTAVHFSMMLDNTPPGVPTALSLSNPSSSPGTVTTPAILVGGVASGDVVSIHSNSTCSVSSQKASGTATSSTITLTSSAVPEGETIFYAKSADALGNESACSTAFVSYTLNSAPPPAPSSITLLSPASSPSIVATPQLRVSGVETGYTVSLYDGAGCPGTAKASGTATGTTIDLTSSALSEGTHEFHAKSVNSLGVASACSVASFTYIMDTTAPTVSLTSAELSSSGGTLTTSTASVTVTFSEAVTGFGVGDLDVIGATPQLMSISSGADQYVFALTITANAGGLVSFTLDEDAAEDLAGNISVAPTAAITATYSPTAIDGTIAASGTQSFKIQRASGSAAMPVQVPLDITTTGDARIPVNQGITQAFTKISASGYNNASYSCALLNGAVYCWGVNYRGRLGNNSSATNLAVPTAVAGAFPTPANGNASFIDIATGLYHACAATSAGEAYCWGTNSFGGLGNGGTTQSFRPVRVSMPAGELVASITAGYQSSCAITTTGKLYCWGYNANGQVGNNSTTNALTPQLVGTDFIKVSTGFTHVCAIKTGGDLYCWGSTSKGELGIGSITGVNTKIPQQVSGSYLDVATGVYVTCAVRADQGVVCWGYNSYGTLGNGGTTGNTNSPPLQAVLTDAASIDGDNYQMCAIKTGGDLYCWGLNKTSQVGDGTQVSRKVPTQVGSNYTAVAVGHTHTCGIRNGKTVCWGLGGTGELGVGNFQILPAPVQLGLSVAGFAAGSASTCSWSGTDEAYCWGDNSDGQLGLGTYANYQPEPALVGSGFTFLAAAARHRCGLKVTDLYCWGYGLNGRLGFGNTSSKYTPALLGAGYSQVSLRGGTTCAIKTNGELYCWGLNDYGQLGVGDQVDRTTPVRVGASIGDGLFHAVAVGASHACAIQKIASGQSGGALYCWGANNTGQLGIGSTSPSLVPVQVGAALYKRVAAGNAHNTCAITDSDDLYCWGTNASSVNQVGDGSATQRNSPVPVMAGTKFASVSVSDSGATSCAVTTSDDLYCWGMAASGRLGSGTATQSAFPTLVGPGYSKVDLGATHGCALKTSGEFVCWGLGGASQMGYSSIRSTPPPVAYGSCTILGNAGTVTSSSCECDSKRCWMYLTTSGTAGTIGYKVVTPSSYLDPNSLPVESSGVLTITPN